MNIFILALLSLPALSKWLQIQTGREEMERGRDLTQRVVIDRHVGLPLSKWRGHGLDFFSA
jgi:hypothetical protein